MTAPLALVMGGSRGLGFLIARELMTRGYRVVIASRSRESLETAAKSLGERASWRVCDATDPQQVEHLVADVESTLGPIHATFHVAGVIQVGPLAATTRKHFQDCIDAMLYGPIHLALAVLPRMTARRRGRFCVISSIGGRVAPPRLVPYSVAKFGALGLAEGLSAELAGTGVSATAAIPGMMRTGSHGAATFYGDPGKQYAWFASVASVPLLSVSGPRAASRIVDATLRGKPVVYVGFTAALGSWLHGAFPSMTIRAMRVVSRFLPRGRQQTPVPGYEARKQTSSKLVQLLTRAADRAAQDSNQPHEPQSE